MTRSEAIKAFFFKSVLPVIVALILYCIFKSACMKGGELDDALAAGGAELAHDLDSSAMNKLPAKKIVNNSANS